MKDEIKEIELDHFNSIEELKQNVETWIKEEDMYWERWFSLGDLKVLLDYITNLKKKYENAVADYEMEKAKNNIIVKLGDEYKSTIDDLQKHCLNQKAKIKELGQVNKMYKKYIKELKDSLRSCHIKNNILAGGDEE